MSTIYVNVDGTPGMFDDTFVKLPKVYLRGEWSTRYDLERFMNSAQVITKDQFDEMMARESGQSKTTQEAR